MSPIAPTLALLLMLGPAAARPRDEPAIDRSGASQLTGEIESRVRVHDPDGAVALGERAVERFPDDSDLWFSLGKAYGEKAQTASVFSRLHYAKKCKAAFERAVELDPKNVGARFALFTYCLEAPGSAGGDPALAERQAEELLKLDSGRGHAAAGSLAVRAKDFLRAEAEFRRAFEAAGDDDARADAQCQLARVYEKLGRRSEAISALREALRLDPDRSEAREGLRRLRAEPGETFATGVRKSNQ